MKAHIGIGVGILGLVIVGCTPPVKAVTPEERKAAFAQEPDKATVIIVTGDSISVLVVDENKNCLAAPNHRDYFIAKMTPGMHEVIALGNDNDGKGVRINVEGGKTYVLKGAKDAAKRDLPNYTAMKLVNDTDRRAVDWELSNDEMSAIDPAKCPEFIKKFWYSDGTFEKLTTALHGAIANAPPIVSPADGIPLTGSSFATSVK